MSYWSVCWRKFAWSWRIPRGLERCSVKDRGRTAASRRWVRARRTTRLRNIAAVGPAPAWRCAICLTRSGRATASQRVVRICTFCKRVLRGPSASAQSCRYRSSQFPEWSGSSECWTSMETSYASEQFSNTRQLSWNSEKRPSIDRSILNFSRQKRRHVRIAL